MGNCSSTQKEKENTKKENIEKIENKEVVKGNNEIFI